MTEVIQIIQNCPKTIKIKYVIELMLKNGLDRKTKKFNEIIIL